MKNIIANMFMLFVVAVALLGQAMAYATMSCGVKGQSTDTAIPSHVEMEHAGMHHEMSHTGMQHDHDQMNSSEEHCATKCECPAGTCNGFSWLAVEPFAMSNSVLHASIQSLNPSHYSLIQTSLYRPPIFA